MFMQWNHHLICTYNNYFLNRQATTHYHAEQTKRGQPKNADDADLLTPPLLDFEILCRSYKNFTFPHPKPNHHLD